MRKFIFYVVILVLLVIFGIGCYYSYIVINCSEAKDYLIRTYDFSEEELKSKKYTQYVYEDIANCSTLWFKECTDNENLKFEYTFETTDGVTIVVSEDGEGQLTDNYKKNTDEVIDEAPTNNQEMAS